MYNCFKVSSNIKSLTYIFVEASRDRHGTGNTETESSRCCPLYFVCVKPPTVKLRGNVARHEINEENP